MQETSISLPNRRLARIALPSIDGQALGLILSSMLLVSFALIKATDPDYWWHLRTGQLVAETRSVPRVDSFSFTAEGKDWVAHEWLSELTIYGLQSLGGYALNALFFGGVALGALLIAYRTTLRLGASRWLALLFFTWAGLMSQAYWVVRPQVFSWLFLALFLAIIVEHQKNKASLWLLPPLMVLWANLHLGCMFGLAVVGLYVVSSFAEHFLLGQKRDLRTLVLVLVACIGATSVTPHPGALLLYPLHYLKPGNNNLELISEWQSPDFHANAYLPFAAALLTLVGIGVFEKTRGLFLPLLTLGFTFLALQSLRNIPLFAIVFFIVAAGRTSGLWRWMSVDTAGGSAPARTPVNLAIVFFFALLLALMVSRMPNQLHETARTDGFFPYPRAGVEYLKAKHSDARVFATYQWGGYVLYQVPTAKVFVDGRSEFYGDALLEDYVHVANLASNWRKILDHHGVDLMLVEVNSALARALDAEKSTWRRVFTGPVEAVFERS